MKLETRTQRVARSVIARVLPVKNEAWACEYRALCRRAGSFVRTSGLASFLAMLASEKSKLSPRAPACAALLTHLREEWLSLYPDPDKGTAPAGDAALLDSVRTADAFDYMFLTRRVLKLLMWHKRFAEALLPRRKDQPPSSPPDGSDSKGEEDVTGAASKSDVQKPEIKARREAVDKLVGALGDNVGLAFARYLPAFDQEAKKREQWLKLNFVDGSPQQLARCPSHACREAYDKALRKYRELFEPAGAPLKSECNSFELETGTRLIIGLGLKGALEFGLTFHPTYGTPLIPGSSLKGVAAAYADQVGGKEWKKNGRQAADLFGGNYPMPNEQKRELAGLVDFFDAWWIPSPGGESPYEIEIVNPHYRQYYAEARRPPDGMENPMPFKFLAVRRGTRFLFCIRGNDPDDRQTARQILEGALNNIGVGGKTRIGYGRFPQSASSASQQAG